MENTIAIVCAKQKDRGDTLVKASVYVRLCKPGNKVFLLLLLLLRTLLEEKMQVIRVRSSAMSFLFLRVIWTLWSTPWVSLSLFHTERLRPSVGTMNFLHDWTRGKTKMGLVGIWEYLSWWFHQSFHQALSVHTPTHKHTLLIPGNQQTHTNL